MKVLDLFRLEGKTALVTGAAQGTGTGHGHRAGGSGRGCRLFGLQAV